MAEKVTTMTLEVDLQCPSCYKKVKKILCKFPEIRDPVYDEKKNLVKITVVSPNPEKIRDKLYCKGGKVIKCIKIEVPKPPEPKPKPPEPKPEPKPELCIKKCEKKCKPPCEKKCKPPCEKKCKPLHCECEKKCKPPPCCCGYCGGCKCGRGCYVNHCVDETTSTNINVQVSNVGVNNPHDYFIIDDRPCIKKCEKKCKPPCKNKCKHEQEPCKNKCKHEPEPCKNKCKHEPEPCKKKKCCSPQRCERLGPCDCRRWIPVPPPPCYDNYYNSLCDYFTQENSGPCRIM